MYRSRDEASTTIARLLLFPKLAHISPHIYLFPQTSLLSSRSASFAPNPNDLSRSETQHNLANAPSADQNRDISPASLYVSLDWSSACRQQACLRKLRHSRACCTLLLTAVSQSCFAGAHCARGRTLDRNVAQPLIAMGPCLGQRASPAINSCRCWFGKFACFAVHVVGDA